MNDELSDVHIKSETPLNYSFTDLPYADIICKAKNLGVPWTSQQLADLMEGLSAAHDAVIEYRKSGNPHALQRSVVVSELQQCGSIHQTAERLGANFEDVVRQLSAQSPAKYWSWSDKEWRDFEAMIFAEGMSVSAVAQTFSMKRNTVYRLLRSYGIR